MPNQREPEAPPYRSVLTRLRDHAERMADKPSLISIDQGSELSWGGLYRACNQVAGALATRGLEANDRVVVLTDNSLENLILYFGVQRYGATFCTVNVEINREHLREIVGRLEPALVLWHDALDPDRLGAGADAPGEWVPFGTWGDADEGGFFAEAAGYPADSEVPEVCGPEDIGVICFTSGTSDKPKGVMHNFANYLLIGEQTKYLWGLSEADRVLEYRSFSWSSSHQICLNPTLAAGDTLIFAQKYSQSRFFDWIRDYEPTVVVGIPTVVSMLLNRPADDNDALLGKLRFMSCSTSPLLGDQHREFEARYGIKLIQHYGMSEGGTVAGNRFDRRRIGSVGEPGMLQNLRIIDEDDNALPTGEEGEIEIGGPQNAYGYLMEDGSVERVRGERLRTGDIGFLDEDGYLHVTGRAKDLVIRGGVNIAPLEIDNAIMRHPDVFEVATVGVPDPIYGEELVSYVAAKPGATLSEAALEAHCADVLPAFKRPKALIVTDDIAKNARGKIDRRAMAERWKETHRAEAG
jgi:acyl-CoA synthetase (AMP-forming)/AMP-acid ligase II